jgi:hypothetical protein
MCPSCSSSTICLLSVQQKKVNHLTPLGEIIKGKGFHCFVSRPLSFLHRKKSGSLRFVQHAGPLEAVAGARCSTVFPTLCPSSAARTVRVGGGVPRRLDEFKQLNIVRLLPNTAISDFKTINREVCGRRHHPVLQPAQAHDGRFRPFRLRFYHAMLLAAGKSHTE